MAVSVPSLAHEIRIQHRLILVILTLLFLVALTERHQSSLVFSALPRAGNPGVFTVSPTPQEAAFIAGLNLPQRRAFAALRRRGGGGDGSGGDGGVAGPLPDDGGSPLVGTDSGPPLATSTVYAPDVAIPGAPSGAGSSFVGGDVLPSPGGSIGGGGGTGSGPVDPGAPAVPEPETWITLLLGLGAIGAFVRTKHVAARKAEA